MLAAASLVAVAGQAGSLAEAQSAVQAPQSAYSRIDEGCVQRQLPDEPVWETTCPGHGGWNVFIIAGEHGAAEAFGPTGEVASDYINPPMRGLFGYFHDVIEWRLSGGRPFAVIHRYVSDTPDPETGADGTRLQTLIVTALKPGTAEVACAMAFVDASALADANAVAREAADRLAGSWDCAREPVWFDAGMPGVGDYLARMGD